MGQMIPITLPADGNWPTIVGDSIMIIGPRQNELTEEQRYFNPVYLMTYPGKEHLKAQMIRAGLCDCDPTIPNRRIGVFSVAPNKQVSFSQGNLQYLPAINLWKFADTQYEYLGNANKYLKPTFRNWVDLFGWSANNTTAPFGVSTSTNAADYAGDFVDWGTNTICGDAPGTWRTLSADEWEYLLNGRENAQQLRTKGSVEGKEGVILLPDNWICPEGYTIAIIPDEANLQSNVNTYSQADWSKLEAAGAIILPSAGMRRNAIEVEVRHPNIFGGYWTCTNKDEHNSYCYTFHTQDCEYVDYSNHIYGRSVRLVHDTIVPETIPEPCFIVKVNDTLSINMMCVEGGTFMMGATEGDTQAYDNEKPAHDVTLTYNYYIAQTEVTQALWKAVMGNNPSTMIGDDLPVNNVLWEEADAFVKRLSQMTGYTFHLPTEAEWEFAARGGKKSKGYLYAGSDDVNEVAWYANNSGGKTHAVGTKKPNELGIYDMSGNAWEWCSDWLAPYSAEAQVNPIGPATGEYHVYHGGGWNHGQRYARSSHRRTTTEGYVKSALGLRVAIRENIEPEAVDLGLSVKWANFNIGAFDPTHYGDYFAWGETEPKETYSWATYKWCDGTQNTMTKYNAADGKTILEPADDAAQVHWGGDWRMPTKEEIQELIDNCTWCESIQNGVKGYVATSKHTGNSIFFPYSGYFNHDNSATLQGEKTLFYTWSAEHSDNTRGYDIHNRAGAILLEQNTRRCGFPIRPVYDDRPPKRIGVFSVAADKQVSFSQGNLQYTQSTDEWRFAREQYEYIGKGNITNGQLGQIIDMFGWSADADPANKWGVTIAQEGFDGDFVDWGLNYIHGEAPGSWRTLSQDEWSYLLSCRQHATELWGVAQVAGVNGVIILPDRWSPTDDLPFVAGINENGYAAQQTLSVEQWQLIEELGAVFLPAAGGRDGASLASSHIDRIGWYWLSTPTDPGKASCVRFECNLMVQRNGWRQAGLSVRLVHDTIVPKPEPEYVDLGLSVKWATFNVGATSPEDDGDYFAWGETETKETYSWATYKWCDGTQNTMTKYNATDGKTILEPADDAAQVHWGGNWRMPSKEEVDELTQQCNWIWTTHNNVNGYKVTGPNGNSIFLPAAGYKGAGPTYPAGEDGLYWTNTLEKRHYSYLIVLHDDAPPTQAGSSGTRCFGFTIRPVYDDRP